MEKQDARGRTADKESVAGERERERGHTAGSSYSCDVTKISGVRFAIGLPAFSRV